MLHYPSTDIIKIRELKSNIHMPMYTDKEKLKRGNNCFSRIQLLPFKNMNYKIKIKILTQVYKTALAT